ncbi:MAG: response regulator [Bacteroidota bacterium]
MNPKSKITILLIEDNPGDANLIKVYLSESSVKHELLHTDTLFDGLEIISNQEVTLVLLDLTLPDSSGFKTLSNFLEKVPRIPVIVLTGSRRIKQTPP